MNDITCEVCKDLIPLVKDAIASEDSGEAVRRHIADCEACRSLISLDTVPQRVSDRIFNRFSLRIKILLTLIMMLGLFFGLSLGFGVEMFFNILLMPVIGILAYIVFRWWAVLYVPPVIFVTFFLVDFVKEPVERAGSNIIFSVSAIYCLIAVAGIVIAGLMHFAFRKDGRK